MCHRLKHKRMAAPADIAAASLIPPQERSRPLSSITIILPVRAHTRQAQPQQQQPIVFRLTNLANKRLCLARLTPEKLCTVLCNLLGCNGVHGEHSTSGRSVVAQSRGVTNLGRSKLVTRAELLDADKAQRLAFACNQRDARRFVCLFTAQVCSINCLAKRPSRSLRIQIPSLPIYLTHWPPLATTRCAAPKFDHSNSWLPQATGWRCQQSEAFQIDFGV